MIAHAALSIVLSLLALLPSPSAQDTGLWLGGSLLGSSKQYSASLNVPSLISGSLIAPFVTEAPKSAKWSTDYPPPNNQNEGGYGNERELPGGSDLSGSSVRSSADSLATSYVNVPSMYDEWSNNSPPRNKNKRGHGNGRGPPGGNGPPGLSKEDSSELSDSSYVNVPSTYTAWNSNSPSFNNRNKNGRGNGRGPPGGNGPPGLSKRGPPGLNGNLPPGWNKGNTENEMYPDTSNERVTHQPPPINENKGPTGPDNRVPNRNEKPQNPEQCRDNEFRCGSNECLPYSVKCDNKVDCRDSSDEASCVTNRNKEIDGCVLPEQPTGGHYELGGCGKPCNKRPGDTVPKNSLLTYSCKNNYILNGNTISVCVNSDWYKPPSCAKICPALNSSSVDISCSYQGEVVSCSERILPGTRARLSCKSSYKLPLTNDPAYREITCLDDGLWDRRIFRCLPECGTSIAHGNTLIVNGFEAKVGTFPWHVGIYRKKRDLLYEQICAGSLVSNNLIISAAHCFYDEGFNKLNDVSNYAVAGGKHYRAWEVDEQYSQKSPVEDIKLGGRYLGARGNFAEDIALVKLKKPFELTALVRPICMDWDNIYEREQLQAGRSGKVVGWGKNIKGESTQTLYEIDMPYVPYQQCLSAVPMNFRGYLTSDKFCAGHLNGSSVCEGDSGGGLCFEKNGIWYIRGIVSVSPVKGDSCDYNSYVGFTYISHFRDWIREAYVNA